MLDRANDVLDRIDLDLWRRMPEAERTGTARGA